MPMAYKVDPHAVTVAGTKVDNYIVDTGDLGAGNDKWTSTTEQTYTVPANKRWLLYGGQVTRDTATGTATLIVNLTDGTNILMNLATEADATGTTSLIADVPTPQVWPIIMDAADAITIVIGEAQGAAAAATCVVLEFDV